MLSFSSDSSIFTFQNEKEFRRRVAPLLYVFGIASRQPIKVQKNSLKEIYISNDISWVFETEQQAQQAYPIIQQEISYLAIIEELVEFEYLVLSEEEFVKTLNNILNHLPNDYRLNTIFEDREILLIVNNVVLQWSYDQFGSMSYRYNEEVDSKTGFDIEYCSGDLFEETVKQAGMFQPIISATSTLTTDDEIDELQVFDIMSPCDFNTSEFSVRIQEDRLFDVYITPTEIGFFTIHQRPLRSETPGDDHMVPLATQTLPLQSTPVKSITMSQIEPSNLRGNRFNLGIICVEDIYQVNDVAQDTTRSLMDQPENIPMDEKSPGILWLTCYPDGRWFGRIAPVGMSLETVEQIHQAAGKLKEFSGGSIHNQIKVTLVNDLTVSDRLNLRESEKALQEFFRTNFNSTLDSNLVHNVAEVSFRWPVRPTWRTIKMMESTAITSIGLSLPFDGSPQGYGVEVYVGFSREPPINPSEEIETMNQSRRVIQEFSYWISENGAPGKDPYVQELANGIRILVNAESPLPSEIPLPNGPIRWIPIRILTASQENLTLPWIDRVEVAWKNYCDHCEWIRQISARCDSDDDDSILGY